LNPENLSLNNTGANNVYMKRFVFGLTSKSMVTTADRIAAYETWLQASHASYTLDRYSQLVLKPSKFQIASIINKLIHHD